MKLYFNALISTIRFLSLSLSATSLIYTISLGPEVDALNMFLFVCFCLGLVIFFMYTLDRRFYRPKPMHYDAIINGVERVEKMQDTADQNLKRIKLYSEVAMEIYQERLGVDHESIIARCKLKNHQLFKNL